MKKVKYYLLLVAFLSFLPQLASAQAIESFTGGNSWAIYYGGSTGDVVGFRFQVNTPVMVTSLGVWNGDNDGLSSDHMVGIWDGTTQIISATVTPAGTVNGDFRYVGISPVTLLPGKTYTAGAMYTASDNDQYISTAGTLSVAPELVFLNAVFPSTGDLGFVYPTEDSPGNFGRFGPNMIFTAANPVAVPTLSMVGLLTLIIGLGGITIINHRRRRDTF